MLKQENGYGCGLYSVANALNMPEFVTEDRLEKSRDGNNQMQLNKWLLDDGCDFQIMPMYFKNHVQFRTPKLTITTTEDLCFYPALVVVALKRCPKNHMFALSIYKDFTLHVLDSCEAEPEYFLSWDCFRKKYTQVISIDVFRTFNNKEVVFCT